MSNNVLFTDASTDALSGQPDTRHSPGSATEPDTSHRRDGLDDYTDALRERFGSAHDLLREAKAQTARRQRRQRAAGGAAAVALVAAIWATDPAWQTEDISAAVGQRASYSLADGSRIDLNTGTVLQVETRLRSRRMVLRQGEALFTVAHTWRPFIVQAGDTSIRDIGTAFNVRLDGRSAVVTVVDGVVEVTAGASRSVLVAPHAVRSQGQHITPLPRSNPGQVTAWQTGRIVFDGTPLADAVADIQRHRTAPIHVADAQAAQLRISGVYDLQGIESLIDALPASLPVEVRRGPDGAVVIAARR